MQKDEKTVKRQREERKRRAGEPIREPGEGWKGQPADDAERQRGEGRGLDEPEKSAPPDDLK